MPNYQVEQARPKDKAEGGAEPGAPCDRALGHAWRSTTVKGSRGTKRERCLRAVVTHLQPLQGSKVAAGVEGTHLVSQERAWGGSAGGTPRAACERGVTTMGVGAPGAARAMRLGRRLSCMR